MDHPYNDEVTFDEAFLKQFVGGFVHGSIRVRVRIVNPKTFRGIIERLEHVNGELRIKMVDDGQPDRNRYQVTINSKCQWLNSSTLVVESPGVGLTVKRIVLTTPMEKM